MENLDAQYWNERYLTEETGWNIGYASYPITAYFDQIEKKDIKILIPGAGNAFEVEYLYNNNFRNVNLLDWSEKAIDNFKERMLEFPKEKLFCENFFDHSGNYDIIVEQTFFCALKPALRLKYVEKVASLLNENGFLIGVLFNKHFEKDGPPFGGTKEEYLKLFEPYFKIEIMDKAYNSIDSRAENELFVKLMKL